jgi:hypothetical protein
MVLKFFRGPDDFRSKKICLLQLRRKPFGKFLFFGKFYINLLAAFQGSVLKCSYWLKTMLESRCFVLKLFWKPIARTQKDFGKMLINHI